MIASPGRAPIRRHHAHPPPPQLRNPLRGGTPAEGRRGDRLVPQLAESEVGEVVDDLVESLRREPIPGKVTATRI